MNGDLPGSSVPPTEGSGSEDPFARFDAAYVIGALSPADREAFVEHLHSCERCSAAVAELAGMPGLLAQVPLAVAEGGGDQIPAPPVPASTLPALLQQVTRIRRRRLIGTAAMALAACFLAVFAVFWPVGATRVTPTATKAGPLIGFTAVQASSVKASADLTPVAWGTKIGLHCAYDKSSSVPYAPGVYSLVVLDKLGNSGQAASWLGVPGRELTINAATAVNEADIAAIEVHAADGETLLRATPNNP